MGNPEMDASPLHRNTLSEALSHIEMLVERGELPFTGKLSRKEKTDRLKDLLAHVK